VRPAVPARHPVPYASIQRHESPNCQSIARASARHSCSVVRYGTACAATAAANACASASSAVIASSSAAYCPVVRGVSSSAAPTASWIAARSMPPSSESICIASRSPGRVTATMTRRRSRSWRRCTTYPNSARRARADETVVRGRPSSPGICPNAISRGPATAWSTSPAVRLTPDSRCGSRMLLATAACAFAIVISVCWCAVHIARGSTFGAAAIRWCSRSRRIRRHPGRSSQSSIASSSSDSVNAQWRFCHVADSAVPISLRRPLRRPDATNSSHRGGGRHGGRSQVGLH